MASVGVSRRVLTVLVAIVAVVGGFVVARASAATTTPVVYVATGENFPDALGASSAAAVRGGPVLLVQRDSIPNVTKVELERLAPSVIYVAGGTAVVSAAVFEELKGYAPTVERLAGSDRYSTAVEVSKSAFPAADGGSAALEAKVAALEAKVAGLEALLAGVSRSGDVLLFEGMNLQIVNGLDSTRTSNGLGNVIIGYNEDLSPIEDRTGSHYLVLGVENAYTKYAGIIAGELNTASGNYASVLGGRVNTVTGSAATVSGGFSNAASGNWASVSGGKNNVASGGWASVTGGEGNTADGLGSSVTGGLGNQVVGDHDTVVGGDNKVNIGWDGAIAIGEGFWDPSDP